MYGGLDKGSGGVVGPGSAPFLKHDFEGDVEGVVGSASADETICCVEEDGTKAFLTARINPLDGELKWCKNYDEDAVMRRTIGMNLMTSMLHDDDRNRIYEKAISMAISNFLSKNDRPPTVLDIGTGTGLLAMLAVKHGASYVVACEMFEAMADVAKKVVELNGFSDRILVVNAKSSDIESLPFSPDILVSELLDSALLGEGVLFSHSDAISRLMLTEGDASDNHSGIASAVVPFGAKVFATAVNGEQVKHMTRVDKMSDHLGGALPWRKTFLDTNLGNKTAAAMSSCSGGSKMIPVHWEAQECSNVECSDDDCSYSHRLSEPVEIMNFEFFRKTLSECSFEQTITATKRGAISGLLVWWRLDMLSPEVDSSSDVSYSTEPGAQNWQDHWQQVVYPLDKDYQCDVGDEFTVVAHHNGINIWLEVTPLRKRKVSSSEASAPVQIIQSCSSPPQCCCGWHVLHSSERLQMLNDHFRMVLWEKAVGDIIAGILQSSSQSPTPKCVLDLSDGSILSIIASMRAKSLTKESGSMVQQPIRVISVERKELSQLFYTQLSHGNDLEECLEVIDGESWHDLKRNFSLGIEMENGLSNIDVILSECFYFQLHAQPLLSAMSFYYSVKELASSNRISRSVTVCPHRARVMVAAFELEKLHRNHGQAGSPRGLDHSPLDKAQLGWSDHWFPYKLGMYKKKLLTAPACVAILNYQDLILGTGSKEEGAPQCIVMPVLTSGVCHCMALWVDIDVTPSSRISYWDGNFPQYLKTNVKFFEFPKKVEGNDVIKCSVDFCDESVGEISFDIDKARA